MKKVFVFTSNKSNIIFIKNISKKNILQAIIKDFLDIEVFFK